MYNFSKTRKYFLVLDNIDRYKRLGLQFCQKGKHYYKRKSAYTLKKRQKLKNLDIMFEQYISC